MGATLVYLYGPPAVGKLTVATEVQRRTKFRLFHNHLTVNALRSVFDFGTAEFNEMIRRVRLDVFETAARHGVDIIFTNSSIWGVPNGRKLFEDFAGTARQHVERAGGRVLFVQLVAPADVLERRVRAASRREHGKLVDVSRLRELLAVDSGEALHRDDLVIDTASMSPTQAATVIAVRLGFGDQAAT